MGLDNFDHIEAVRPKIQKRGQVCCTRAYQGLLKEMLNNLYVHSSSKEDIRIEMQSQMEKEAHQRIHIQQMMSVQNTIMGGQQSN